MPRARPQTRPDARTRNLSKPLLTQELQRSAKRRGCLLSYSQAEPGRELTQPSSRLLAEPCTLTWTVLSIKIRTPQKRIGSKGFTQRPFLSILAALIDRNDYRGRGAFLVTRRRITTSSRRAIWLGSKSLRLIFPFLRSASEITTRAAMASYSFSWAPLKNADGAALLKYKYSLRK